MRHKPISDSSTAVREATKGTGRASRVVPALTIASHPMPHRVGERLLLEEIAAGKEVALSRNSPSFQRPGSALGAPLVDPFVSRKPVRFLPGDDGSIEVVPAEGLDVLVAGKAIRGNVEIAADDLKSGVPIELAGRVTLVLHRASNEEAPGDRLGMVGESAALWKVRSAIEQVVDLQVPVLIRGETGTGKELVAEAIHERSPRRSGPFVAVNLGALPKDIAAAELFGAKKGAFTGATHDREGLFRAAEGGTLFLDEVGEAPPDVQVLLLRVLETGKLYPVGGHTPIAVDVRLISATDADLEERIRQGQFKAPLLHRLSGYEIRLPPLRERREDIGLLFHHFAKAELETIAEGHRLTPVTPHAAPWLSTKLATKLITYSWPGNVRQLRNVTRQLVIGSRGKPVLDDDLPIVRDLEAPSVPPPGLNTPPGAASTVSDKGAPRKRKSTEVTTEELLVALRESGWDVKAAAERLNVARSSIYDLIDRHPEIRTAGDLGAEEIERCFRECGGDLDRMVERLRVSKRALNRRVKELGIS